MTPFTARLLRIALVMIPVLLASGCAGLRPGLAGTPCPVEWAATGEIDPEAAPRHARVQLRVQDRTIRLELVTQVRPEEIVVVGLAGYGVRLFTIRQTGQALAVEGAASPELEFVARWLMDALHRSFWIEPSARDSSGAGLWGEERVLDTPAESAAETPTRYTSLRSHRRFEMRGRRAGASAVTIAYPGFPEPPRLDSQNRGGNAVQSDSSAAGDATTDRKATLRIRNPWCGYEAVLAPL